MAPKCHSPIIGKQVDEIVENIVEESFKGQANTNVLFQGILVIPKKMVKSRLRRAMVEMCNANPVDCYMLTRMEHIFLLEIFAMREDPKLQEHLEAWGQTWVMALEISRGNPVVLYALMRHARENISHRGKTYTKDLTKVKMDLKKFAAQIRGDKALHRTCRSELEEAEKNIAEA